MPNHVRLKRKLARILDREGILNKPVYKEENETGSERKTEVTGRKGGQGRKRGQWESRQTRKMREHGDLP